MNWEIERAVAKSVSIKRLYEEDNGELVSSVIICPFHYDKNPSAKFYHDEDGVDRLFCYACKKQFTSYHYILEIRRQDPATFPGVDLQVKPKEVESKPVDWSKMDLFKEGKITIEEFVRAIMEV